MYSSKEELIKMGFSGFKTVHELCVSSSVIPRKKGVYVVINSLPDSKDFLTTGPGGRFKGKDPNVSIDELHANWVAHATILYIGQAGGNSSTVTLQKRIKQYLDFGDGKTVGHWGGRLIWQIAHHRDLVIAWKTVDTENPYAIETELLATFKGHYGQLPFANMKMSY